MVIPAPTPLAPLATPCSAFAKIRTRGGASFLLVKPYYLVYLEAARTLREVVAGRPPLITNSAAPSATIAAVAKRPLPRGHQIDTALGGFDLRGEAVEIAGLEAAVPITLLDGARLTRRLEPGEIVTEADVELPETLAHRLYREAVPVGGAAARGPALTSERPW